MPLYAKDRAGVTDSANALSALIVGDRQKRDSQKQAEQHKLVELIKGQELEQQATDYNIAQAQDLRKQLPAGSAVNVKGVSMNTPDPMANMYKRLDMDAKSRDDFRMETAALQNEHKKLGGNDPDKLRAYDDIEANLGDINVNNVGQLRAMLARGVEKGVLTDQDIQRYLPGSLAGDLKKGLGYLGVGAGELGQVITPEQKKNIAEDIKKKRANMVKAHEAATRELSARAPMLAPTLQASGRTDQVLQSLGGTVRDAAQQKKPKSVIQNGVTYTLDEATGEYK